jgi:hypothetical protein
MQLESEFKAASRIMSEFEGQLQCGAGLGSVRPAGCWSRPGRHPQRQLLSAFSQLLTLSARIKTENASKSIASRCFILHARDCEFNIRNGIAYFLTEELIFLLNRLVYIHKM